MVTKPPPLIKRAKIADRWQCCTKTVSRRMQAFGIKPIKLGHKSIFYRLEDILAAEERCRS